LGSAKRSFRSGDAEGGEEGGEKKKMKANTRGSG